MSDIFSIQSDVAHRVVEALKVNLFPNERERLGRSGKVNQEAYELCLPSRRRHTRCSRDWSSDVCSSDLVAVLFDPLDTATAPAPIYGEDDSLTQKPALLFGPPINYPEDLRRNRIQGRVVVQAILDTLGGVEQESIQFVVTPDPGFLMPVSQYLALARFRPARRNGRLVRLIVHMPVDFRLRGVPFPCPMSAEFRFRCRP